MPRSELRAPVDEIGLADEIGSELKEGLREDLIAIVLFGSRARGEAREGSDWDVLVVADSLPGRTLERAIRLKRMLPAAYRGEVSLLAKTPEEFMSNLPDLYLHIALDGVVLYDTDGFIVERMRALETLIRRKGLRCEREGRDPVWRWQRTPAPNWSLEWGEAL